ncbi:hypothetical protein L798_06510 [Zootermopsis nevadensis]|uniref:Uncharacterized protein n=1 Tax=Zootermopsis nevadensis TaxID=136037 RepID=A0A067R7X2_ZOONE|nr:hypothetical protein L798_06510 [Zootermopsis nevadensis]
MVTDITSDEDQEPQSKNLTVNKSPLNFISKSPCRRTNTSHVSFTSNISLVYACLVWLLLTELVLSYCLYTYIAHVDRECTSAIATLAQQSTIPASGAGQTNPFQDFEFYRRRKRGARSPPPTVMEDNTVDPSGMAGVEGANVEFFNPKLRQELEEKENRNGGGKKGSNNAGSGATSTEGESANNPWVWLTSYSRIPVSRHSLRIHRLSVIVDRKEIITYNYS